MDDATHALGRGWERRGPATKASLLLRHWPKAMRNAGRPLPQASNGTTHANWNVMENDAETKRWYPTDRYEPWPSAFQESNDKTMKGKVAGAECATLLE